ncbi:putative RNA recognition motif domain, nucleotide-binding alpha-beta plait domain superfamily [Helianthus anomalus]
MRYNDLTSVTALAPGLKIFIGGLAKDTTIDTFVKYFGKYGDLTDSVVMKDRQTGRPRGFRFVTYADPSVVDTVIAETHAINGKQVSEFLFLVYFGYE